MKLIRANNTDLIDKIEAALRLIRDAYCTFEDIAYIDDWEFLEGLVLLVIGEYDHDNYEVQPFKQMTIPFHPDWVGNEGMLINGVPRKDIPNMRVALEQSLAFCLEDDLYNEGNRLAFRIMVNGLRFIESLDQAGSSEEDHESKEDTCAAA